MKTIARFFACATRFVAPALAFLFTFPALAAWSGAGTESDPFVISDAAGLQELAGNVNGGNAYEGRYFALDADIALTGNWTPIGNGSRVDSSFSGNAFGGVFDGAGFEIRGLTISAGGKDAAIGLFGVVNGGTVKNLKLAEVSINATANENAGGAIGLMVNGATADHITVSGSVTAKRGNGGIVGRMTKSGTISFCVNNAAVSGSAANVGGIVGAAYYTEIGKEMVISNCKNHGTVTGGASNVGGITGFSSAIIGNCENDAAVSGGGYGTSGIVGEQQNYGSVSGCRNSGMVVSSAGSSSFGIGGIVGWLRYSGDQSNYPLHATISVTDNTNSASVSGGASAGGIIGHVYHAAVVTGNINTAPTLAASVFAAGIVGSYQNAEGGKLAAIATTSLTVTGNVSTTKLEDMTVSGSCKSLYVYDNTTGADGVTIADNTDTLPVANVGGTLYSSVEEAVDAAAGVATEETPAEITVAVSAEASVSLTEFVAKIAAKVNANISLTVPTANGTVSFNKAAVVGIKTKAGNDEVEVRVESVSKPENVTASANAAFYDITLTGADVSADFGADGEATITLPVPAGLVNPAIYYIDGTAKTVIDSVVASGRISFKTTHLSTYAVDEGAPTSVAFIDANGNNALDDGEAGYETINAAVAAANNGDVIVVLPGRTEEFVCFYEKSLTFKAQYPAYNSAHTLETDESKLSQFAGTFYTNDGNDVNGVFAPNQTVVIDGFDFVGTGVKIGANPYATVGRLEVRNCVMKVFEGKRTVSISDRFPLNRYESNNFIYNNAGVWFNAGGGMMTEAAHAVYVIENNYICAEPAGVYPMQIWGVAAATVRDNVIDFKKDVDITAINITKPTKDAVIEVSGNEIKGATKCAIQIANWMVYDGQTENVWTTPFSGTVRVANNVITYYGDNAVSRKGAILVGNTNAGDATYTDISANAVIYDIGNTEKGEPVSVIIKKSENGPAISAAIDFAEFKRRVIAGNGTYDGNGVTVKWSPESGIVHSNMGSHMHTSGTHPTQAATGNTPERVNDRYAQYWLLADAVANINISNVNFVFVPTDFAFCNQSYGGDYTAETAPTAKVYCQNDGNVTFTDCTFDHVGMGHYGPTGKIDCDMITVTDCTFRNIYNNYAIKTAQSRGYSITGCTFTDCGGAIMLNTVGSAQMGEITITDNTFENIDVAGTTPENKIGTRGVIQIAAGPDYSKATITVKDNEYTNCSGTFRQLNASAKDATLDIAAAELSYTSNTEGANEFVTQPAYVATVTINGETEDYTDLLAAINAAKNGGKVQLLCNVTVSDWHRVSQANVEIDGELPDGTCATLTIASIDENCALNGGALFHCENANSTDSLTIRNLNIVCAARSTTVIVSSELTLDNVNIDAGGAKYVIETRQKVGGGDGITIVDCEFSNYTSHVVETNNGTSEDGMSVTDSVFNGRGPVLCGDSWFVNNTVNSEEKFNIFGTGSFVAENTFNGTGGIRFNANDAATFVENKVITTVANPILLASGVTSADVSGNYWGGEAPANLPDGVTVTSYYNNADMADEHLVLIQSAPWEGAGTEADPYQIATVDDLTTLAAKVNVGNAYAGKYFKVMADITLPNGNWTPIGTTDNPFSGHFDGDNHFIDGLTLASGVSGTLNSGFFGCVKGVPNDEYATAATAYDLEAHTLNAAVVAESKYTAVIKNLRFTNVAVNENGGQVGVAVGCPYDTYISNIRVLSGSFAAGKNSGGIAGRIYSTVLNGCETGCDLTITSVKDGYGVGGIVGSVSKVDGAHHSIVMGCVNNASVSTDVCTASGIGGIVGALTGSGDVIYGCTNNGAVTLQTTRTGYDVAQALVGGITGGQSTTGEIIADCVNNGAISGGTAERPLSGIAGIANYYKGTIYNTVNNGNLSGYAYRMGGICATINGDHSLTIDACSNTGTLSNSLEGALNSTISATGTGNTIYYKNMTFATTADLQAALPLAGVGSSAVIELSGVTVTDPSGELVIPDAFSSFSADTKIADSIPATWSNLVTLTLVSAEVVIPNGTSFARSLTVNGTNVKIVNNGDLQGGIRLSGSDNTLNNTGTIRHHVSLSGTNSSLNNYGTIVSDETTQYLFGFSGTGNVFNNHGTVTQSNADYCMSVMHFTDFTLNNHSTGVINYPGRDGGQNIAFAYGPSHEDPSLVLPEEEWSVFYLNNAGRLVHNGETETNPGVVCNSTAKVIRSSSVPVAKIGDVPYETLAAAIEAAEAGGTVTLLCDVPDGDGLTITKPITLDLNGKTYTVTQNFAGSSGTKNQCVQILQSANGVTIKNGTIAAGAAGVKMIVQNYADLTLTDVTLKGGEVSYALSNNCGAVLLNGATTVEGKMDVSYWPSAYPAGSQVTVNTTGTIGSIELGFYGKNSEITLPTKSVLTLTSGTVGDISVHAPTTGAYSVGDVTTLELMEAAQVTKGDSVDVAAPEGYVWKDGVLTPVSVAKFNNVEYASIEAAIKAVVDAGGTGTITLLSDITVSKPIIVNGTANKTVTIDATTEYTVTATGRALTEGLFQVESGTLTLKGGNCEGKWADAVFASGFNAANGIAVKVIGGKYQSAASYVAGDIIVESGAVSLGNSLAYMFGNVVIGEDISTESSSFCSITRGKYYGDLLIKNGYSFAGITGGDFTFYGNGTGTIRAGGIRNGLFYDVGTFDLADGAITGGTYQHFDVSNKTKHELAANLLADGYIQDDTGKVGKLVAKIGEMCYTSIADAIAAANENDTISVMCDTSIGITISKSVTLDFGGHKLQLSGGSSTMASLVTVGKSGESPVNVKIMNGSILANAARYSKPTITVNSGATVEFDNVNIESIVGTAAANVSIAVNGKDASITLTDSHITTDKVGINAKNYSNTTIVIDNSTISTGKSCVQDASSSGDTPTGNTVVVKNGSILTCTGNDVAIIHNGTGDNYRLTIEDSTVASSGMGIYISGGDNMNQTINIANSTVSGKTALEAKNSTVKITDSTMTATTATPTYTDNGSGACTTGFAVALTGNASTVSTGSLTISGDKTNITGPISLETSGIESVKNVHSSVEIFAGTYTVDPSEECASGYTARDNENGTWTIVTANTLSIATKANVATPIAVPFGSSSVNWKGMIETTGLTGVDDGVGATTVKVSAGNSYASYYLNAKGKWVCNSGTATDTAHVGDSIWITTPTDATVTIKGILSAAEPDVTIVKGVNLVSFPAVNDVDLNNDVTWTEALQTTPTQYDSIETVQPGTGTTCVWHYIGNRWVDTSAKPGDPAATAAKKIVKGQGFAYIHGGNGMILPKGRRAAATGAGEQQGE